MSDEPQIETEHFKVRGVVDTAEIQVEVRKPLAPELAHQLAKALSYMAEIVITARRRGD